MTKKRDTWRGHAVYRCSQCAFSTLHEGKLTDHTAKAHPSRRARPAPQESEQLDPLGELSNDEFEALTPQEKGARTRAANEASQQDAQSGDSKKGNE